MTATASRTWGCPVAARRGHQQPASSGLPPVLQETVGRGTALTWAARSISCSWVFFTALAIMTGEYFSSSSFSCEGRQEVTQLSVPLGHNAVTWGCHRACRTHMPPWPGLVPTWGMML